MPRDPLVGARLPRREDARFLTGRGRFTDDLSLDGEAHASIVRSPHAHAAIARVDLRAARAAPGVLAALAAPDLADDVPNPIPSLSRTEPFAIPNRDGTPAADASQPVLARDRVLYLGEPVAIVIAETPAAARDAAELVEVDYDPLPPLMTIEDARAAGAPRLWDDAPGNVSLDWERGDATAVDEAFAGAAHAVAVELVNNRVVPSFMEPRSAIAAHDAATGRFTLWSGSQSAHRLQAAAADVLGLDADRIRVLTPDTGGGFGARNALYPEHVLVLAAARRVGRPVRWTADRSESFLGDAQARDHVLRGELAIDAAGRFTAMRFAADWRHGAYLGSRNLWVAVSFLAPTVGGVYRIPAAHLRIRGVFSNTTPHAAYRGIGRVEATYLVESLVDAAARAIGADPVELRRRNLVRPADLPWRAPGGSTYHDCDFEPGLDRALAIAGRDGFEGRRAEAAARGRLRGLGVSLYVENDGGAPSEYAEVEARADGSFAVRVGTQDFGMGHATAYAQILADRLGVAIDRIGIVEGDTDAVARGAGSAGSRSMRIGGTAIVMGADRMLEKGRAAAAEMLEASQADVEFADGGFRVAGTDRAVAIEDVAARIEADGDRLAADADFDTVRPSHSNGCHACEVEVDPETGVVAIVRHVVVADAGRAVNPSLVEGQLHGGAAQGLGQAALERVVYDPESGQTLTGSYMDYAIPRADDLPFFDTVIREVRETDNPLGVKGVGEGPTTGAPAAFMNALRDALAAAGVESFDMPATPLRVWEAIRAARS